MQPNMQLAFLAAKVHCWFVLNWVFSRSYLLTAFLSELGLSCAWGYFTQGRACCLHWLFFMTFTMAHFSSILTALLFWHCLKTCRENTHSPYLVPYTDTSQYWCCEGPLRYCSRKWLPFALQTHNHHPWSLRVQKIVHSASCPLIQPTSHKFPYKFDF